jgi:hypothetical protein
MHWALAAAGTAFASKKFASGCVAALHCKGIAAEDSSYRARQSSMNSTVKQLHKFPETFTNHENVEQSNAAYNCSAEMTHDSMIYAEVKLQIATTSS